MLNIKLDTGWRWVQAGYLPAIRLGRRTKGMRRRCALRFDLDAVRRWAEGQAQPGRKERVPEIEVPA